MYLYQKAVKDAGSAYFSQLLSKNNHNPKVLFKIIGSVISGPSTSFPAPEIGLSDKFLDHFMNKAKNIRSQIHPDPHILSISYANSALFTHFQPVTISALENIVSHMNFSSCILNIIPTKLLKEIFPTINSVILHISNSSLASGSFPHSLKHAIIQPLLKKPNMDPLVTIDLF